MATRLIEIWEWAWPLGHNLPPPRFSIILGQARYKGSPDNDWDADRHLLGCVVVELLVKYWRSAEQPQQQQQRPPPSPSGPQGATSRHDSVASMITATSEQSRADGRRDTTRDDGTRTSVLLAPAGKYDWTTGRRNAINSYSSTYGDSPSLNSPVSTLHYEVCSRTFVTLIVACSGKCVFATFWNFSFVVPPANLTWNEIK